MDLESAARVGVKWIENVAAYRVGKVVNSLKRDPGSRQGLRVVIADGECILARQRREKPITTASSSRASAWCEPGSAWMVHLHGRPFLHSTVGLSHAHHQIHQRSASKNPVAHVTNGCVGCGNCGDRTRGDPVPVVLQGRYHPESLGWIDGAQMRTP